MLRNPREVLGRGWSFPFQFESAQGGVALSEYEENIRQCICVIIGTRPGERQMLPNFGCRIHELLFAPNTSQTASQISYYVRDALDRFEPRIEVQEVTSVPDPNGGGIKVSVKYKIKATSAVQNLNYTVSNR
ncbi:MAG: GPW/gp25 family protein [Myxococcota bacterium]